jgi:hypothetical protein
VATETETPKKQSVRAPKLRATSSKQWKLPGVDEVFVQDPLTFFEKNDFLGLVSRALERALASGYDLRALVVLMGGDTEQFGKMLRGEGSDEFFSSFGGALGDSLGLLMRVFSLAPQTLEEAYLLMLSIPPERHDELRPALRRIDDEQGFAMFQLFVDQNASTIRDFLGRWREQFEVTTTKIQATTTPISGG